MTTKRPLGTMTIAELKEIIKDIPDETPIILQGGYDHSYNTVHSAEFYSAGYQARGKFFEWYDEDSASPGEKEVKAFIIG